MKKKELTIKPESNFIIESKGPLSETFRELGIFDFENAALFIKNLPYSRNKNKSKLLSVFADKCGTCGTKHALLKQLATENKIGVKLMIGIFKMNSLNTPKVAKILGLYGLSYLPEAHNYLRSSNQIIDCSHSKSSEADFINELMVEIEIYPEQIIDFKVAYHKAYLTNWIRENKIQLTLDELWEIREACVLALSQ
nr:hypothetical protein [Pseudopedobacter sp.]